MPNTRLKNVVAKADVLLEALPYLQAFRGKTFVVKFGGNALANDEARRLILQDIAFLSIAGIRPVLVHGGAPEITRQMSRKGRKPRWVQGLRVTDRQTLEVVERSLRKINHRLVAELKTLGARAQGLKGYEAGLIRAERHTLPGVDLGFVGKVTGVSPGAIQRLLVLGVIPVVVPLASGWDGQWYNVNADYAASALASALKAEKFVLVTDVPGILLKRQDAQSLISTLTIARAKALIRRGTIDSGMIPKTEACIAALRGGARKTHLVDVRTPHALLLEIFTDRGIGTEIVKR
ncbi:MAG: acetylglutamate kinase [Candidatus Omnitrophica bacterium]|nr:acetylglutamate kinase [Candidatus Omnitrophota bacterium]